MLFPGQVQLHTRNVLLIKKPPLQIYGVKRLGPLLECQLIGLMYNVEQANDALLPASDAEFTIQGQAAALIAVIAQQLRSVLETTAETE